MPAGTNRTSLVLLSLALALPAGAADLHVSAASTTGVEDGSAANPFTTIQPAIDAAVAGDRVLVAPGVYYGAVALKSRVPLVGVAGPAATVIDGMAADTAVAMPYENPPDCSIDGFTVRNAYQAFNVTNRVSFWGGAQLQVSNAIVRDVGLAFRAYPSSSLRVTRTLVTRVGTAADAIWCGHPQFVNVTVDGVTGEGGSFVAYQTGFALTNVTLSNAAAAFGTWGHRGSAFISGSGNNLWNVATALVPGWEGQLPWTYAFSAMEADPAFVNALAGDFRLSPASPLVDAGVDAGLPYTGAAPDIGAYEAGLTIEAAAQALAESYAAVPLPAYKNAAEQRRHALSNKMLALIGMLASISPSAPVEEQLAVYAEALAKLENDVWAKADGFYGGNPSNDWIRTQEEQAALLPRVEELRDLIRAELARLAAN